MQRTTNKERKQTTMSLRPYKITLLSLTAAALILAVAITALKLNPIKNSSASSDPLTAFMNLSKEDAISSLNIMNGTKDYYPKGFLPESLHLNENESARKLLYSYENVNEISQIASDSAMGLSIDHNSTSGNFVITADTDYYAVVSINSEKVNCEKSCYKGISFDKKYLNHYQETIDSNYSNRTKFNDVTLDFAKIAMPIIVADDSSSHLNTMYDYYFEETDSEITLTMLHIEAGVNLDKISQATEDNIPLALNLYKKVLVLNKETGRTSWKEFEDVTGTTKANNLRTIPISKDEYAALAGEDGAVAGNPTDATASKLTNAVRAICVGNFSVIYQTAEDTGIFQCKDAVSPAYREIYSVTSTENGPAATYLGSNFEDTVSEYFGSQTYIYRNYRHSDIPNELILLVQAPSENEAIMQIVEPTFEYIKSINERRKTDINLYVFYTDSLDQVKEVKDYILLSGIVNLYDWLPHGNSFGNYYFKGDSTPALTEIIQNPGLFPNQVRDAVKSHRHILANINNGRDITIEQFAMLLKNSFKDYTGQ